MEHQSVVLVFQLYSRRILQICACAMMEPIISNKTVSQPVLWDIMEAQLETIVPSVKMVVQFVPIQEIHVAVVSMFLSALLMECAMSNFLKKLSLLYTYAR